MTAISRFNWYAVQTQSRAEMKASTHLARQGFDVYLPRFQKKRRHARRTDEVPAPLFPGYLFVAIHMAMQRWRCINSTVGVGRLVCNGETPAIVDDAIIVALKGRHDERGFIKLDKPRFAAGEKVMVIDGVFSESRGICEEMSDRQRVAVLLDLLGRKVRVEMGVDSLATA